MSSINRVLRNLAAQKEQQIASSSNCNSNPSTNPIPSVNGNGSVNGVGGSSSSAVGGTSSGAINDQIQTATPLNSSESGGASNSGEGSEQESIYEKLRLLNTQHASALDSGTTLSSSSHSQLLTSVPNHFSPHPLTNPHSNSTHTIHTRSAHQHNQQSWPPRHYSTGSWYSTPLNGTEFPVSPGVINGSSYSSSNVTQVAARSSDPPLSPSADLINIGGAVHLNNCLGTTEDVMLKKGEFRD